ncbi:Glyoxalase/Bleomycin resistance protein/Dihydroxybiphenyl dioxygenase [Aspergillus venezuelensis]
MDFDPNSEFLPSSRIDHVGITAPSEQFESLVEFYKSALAPLKYKELMRFPGAIGLGDQVPDFWISEANTDAPQGFHFAFVADDRAAVDAFHTAALAAGGKCKGKPGLRSEYHPNYYAAFIWDPRGNNVEIVRSNFVYRALSLNSECSTNGA